jgi:hypothetical protein
MTLIAGNQQTYCITFVGLLQENFINMLVQLGHEFGTAQPKHLGLSGVCAPAEPRNWPLLMVLVLFLLRAGVHKILDIRDIRQLSQILDNLGLKGYYNKIWAYGPSCKITLHCQSCGLVRQKHAGY